MNKLEVFTKARDLVAKGWTQKNYAVNSEGRPCASASPMATCFCASGALIAAMYFVDEEVMIHNQMDFFRTFRKVNALESIPSWNDNPERTQAEVIAAFDKVINSVGG